MTLEQHLEAFERLCPCCGADPEFTPLSICCDNMDLVELGDGYVLYFKMIIYFVCITVVILGINIYKLVVNFKGDHCSVRPAGADLDTTIQSNGEVPPCYIDWITPHSIANYGIGETDIPERCLMVIFLGLFWCTLAGIRHRVLVISNIIDCKNDTCSDFTLTVTNILLSSKTCHYTTEKKTSKRR